MVGQLRLIGTKTNLIISSAAVFLSCFVLSFVASSFIIQPQGSKAATGLVLVGTPTMTLSADGAAKTLNPNPTMNNGLASASSTLTASTNVPTGYSLALSATAIGARLGASTGTAVSPVALAANTWGYALAKSGAVGITNGFDTSYTAPTPSTTSKWANPTTPTTIKNTTTSATNDQTNIYYGTKADISLPSGTYTSTVTYTATANITDIPTPTITSVTPATGSTAGGTQVQIVGTGFTVNDQSVTTAVTIDNQACTNVTISSNTPITGQDTIYCTTPAHPTAGVVNITVTTWKSTATKTSAYTYIAPTATITTPTQNQILAAGTTSTTLAVTTDLQAICYYGTATNPTTAMSTTGGTTHTQSITGLTNTSTNTRYVRCNALIGHNYGSNTSVTFYVRAATPPAPTLTPAAGATVGTGTNYIYITSNGATCMWGTSSGSYPYASGASYNVEAGTNTLYYYCVAGSGYTVMAQESSWSFTGIRYAQTGDYIQSVTTANCTNARIRVVDARDGATYWVQQFVDGRCYMLTNLAYGGGGNNTYGDVKNIINSNAVSFSQPYYMIPVGANRTTGTTDPIVSIDGAGQYGYLYNWCAALGVQIGTSACSNATSPLPDTNISICPSGWRLLTGGSSGGEFAVLNNTANGGLTNDSAQLRYWWLGMYGGLWDGNFLHSGISGYYWASTQNASNLAYVFTVQNGSVLPGDGAYFKYGGLSVRCVAI